MSCEAIIDIVTRETGRFGPEIYNRVFPRSPWIGIVRKAEFPAGMGEVISNLTYERTAPTTAETDWQDVTVVDGSEGGACLPPVNKVGIASTVRNYNLQRIALEGPDFCAEELRTPFQIRKQLEAILSILSDYSMLEWERRYRHEYLRLVGKKVVIEAAQLTEGTGEAFPAVEAGGQLTQGILNKYKTKLFRDGATNSALGMQDGAAILTLITSAEQSDRLIFQNDDIRQDLRWGKPNELLAPYGVERSYRGWYHLLDAFPLRFNFTGGDYVEVPAFDTTAATKGTKARVNPDWETASYEVSFAYDPTVMLSRVPRPIVNPANNFRFDPVNYMGNWSLKNIQDRVCNPDGTIVFHRGILASGSEPIHPERGIAFMHLRCDPELNLVTSCT